MKLLGCILALILIFSDTVSAQILAKHPRVAELENTMVKDASSFLKGRFPDMPFLVSISIDPLRRGGDSYGNKKSTESLPYLEYGDEEITDEWDDPGKTLFALMARVKKIQVVVSLSTNVKEDEIAEIQETLTSLLNLIKARDNVTIQRRNWGDGNTKWWLYGSVGAGLLLTLLILWGISRNAVTNLGKSLGELQGALKNGVGAGNATASVSVANREPEKVDQDRGVKLSDPLKTREVVGQTIKVLTETHGFPHLLDIVILDRLGHQKPAALGALLTEFPQTFQEQIFSYSYGDWWLEAFADPGELTSESLEVLQKLIRNPRPQDDEEWQRLLLLVWHLNKDRVKFVRSLKQEDALAILSRLPKSIAIATAREAFPGSWGPLLAPETNFKNLGAVQLSKLTEQAIAMGPRRSFEVVTQYRQERDLLEYLKSAEPNEEREIYGASPVNSVIHEKRPPFFKVFDLDKISMETLVASVPLDEWALAMFNISKNDRKNIEGIFSDRQRFMFFERMKKLDSSHPDKIKIGSARERIAKIADQLSKQVLVKEPLSAPTGITIEPINRKVA